MKKCKKLETITALSNASCLEDTEAITGLDNLLLAHSEDIEKHILSQSYRSHSFNVYAFSGDFLEEKKKYIDPCLYSAMRRIVLIASIFHDMGKLDDQFQSMLRRLLPDGTRGINHVDAGVAYTLLLFEKTGDPAYLFAAFLIHAHHIGLQNFSQMFKEMQIFFAGTKYSVNKKEIRDFSNPLSKYLLGDGFVAERVDELLLTYVERHNECLKGINFDIPDSDYEYEKLTCLDIRIMLSILVDADHTDTSNHYGNVIPKPATVNPKKLSKRLKKFSKAESEKNKHSPMCKIRTMLFNKCGRVKPPLPFALLDACVSSAKTLAGLNLALKEWDRYDMSGIIYGAPFANIISQTTDTFRKALLEEDDPEIVKEIHLQMDFSHIRLRQFCKIWDSPIILSSSVQIMETMAANRTGRLRKLHRFIGKYFIFDEYHQFMLNKLWGIGSVHLEELASKYSCRFLFMSGSSVHLWKTQLVDNLDVFKIVTGNSYKRILNNEKKRCAIKKVCNPFNSMDEFYRFVTSESGSKLIILDTVRNAAVVANYFVNKNHNVFHLSSALSPKHKRQTIKRIKEALKTDPKNVVVVATSSIECGVDISCDRGYRESPSFSSAIQSAGRINRHLENSVGILYVFSFSEELRKNVGLTQNPSLKRSRDVFESMREDQLTPDYCTIVLQKEIDLFNREDKSTVEKLKIANMKKDFPTINELFRVIESETETVIVDKEVVNKLKEDPDKVSSGTVYNNSVQIWNHKLHNLKENGVIKKIFEDIDDEENMWYWDGDYDPVMMGICADPRYFPTI